MVFGSVFSMGGSSAGSSVGVSEATEEEATVMSTAKDRLRDRGRSSKFGFIRNLPFIANIRQKDAVWESAAGSKEAPHDSVDAPLSKGAQRVAFRDFVGESGPLSAPLSHVSSDCDIDTSAAVVEDIIWGGSQGTRDERRGASNDGNQEPNSVNPAMPCDGLLSKHVQRHGCGDDGKATRSRSSDRKQKVDDKPSVQRYRGRETIDDETLASRRSKETQSSRRSFSTPRSLTGKISLSRRSLNRRREDDAFSANHVTPTAGARSTVKSENDRDIRSSSLGRHEPSSRRPPESPRNRAEKATDSTRLRDEKPPESPRKQSKSSRKFNLASPRKAPTTPRKKIWESPLPPPESPRADKPTDSSRLRGEKPPESPRKRTVNSSKLSVASSRKIPTSPRKKMVESPPLPPDSPRKRTKKATDSAKLRGEKPSESPRKQTKSSSKVSLDSPRKTPTSPGKQIVELPGESQMEIIPSYPTTPYSRNNRVSDSPRIRASDCLKKISMLTGKEYTKRTSPCREKPKSPRKISFSPRRSTSRLTLADQILLEDLTRKMLNDNMDEMRARGNFKAAKTNEVIKKHIQEVAALTGSRQKDSTGCSARASPNGSSSPEESKNQPNRRMEESKSWGEVVRLVGCKQDLPVWQKE